MGPPGRGSRGTLLPPPSQPCSPAPARGSRPPFPAGLAPQPSPFAAGKGLTQGQAAAGSSSLSTAPGWWRSPEPPWQPPGPGVRPAAGGRAALRAPRRGFPSRHACAVASGPVARGLEGRVWWGRGAVSLPETRAGAEPRHGAGGRGRTLMSPSPGAASLPSAQLVRCVPGRAVPRASCHRCARKGGGRQATRL